MIRAMHSRLRPYAIASLASAIAFVLTWLLEPLMSPTVFALFYPSVMVSSLYGGWESGLLSVAIATLATKYFFLEPTFSLTFTNPSILFRLTVLVLVALMICGLSTALRQEQQRTQASLKRLKASEAKFRRLAESNIIGVISADTHGAITEANDAFLNMIGYTREEVLAGRVRWDEMTPPDLRHLDQLALEELTSRGVHTLYEKEYFHKEGHRVPILVGGALLEDDSRENVISFILDLSDRKRAEQRQHIQYAVARVLAEATTLTDAVPTIVQSLCESLGWQVGIIWSVEHQANVLRCLESWHQPQVNVEEFIQVNQDTTFTPGVGLPGRIWASGQPSWISDLLKDSNFSRVASASRGGLRAAFGFPIRVENEMLGVIECFSDKIQEPDADLLQMMAAIGSQIGQFMERKRAEEKLAQSRQLFLSFMNHSPARAYIKDEAGRYIYVNSKLERDFNRPLADWLGKTDFDFMPAEIAQQWRENDLAVLASNQPIESLETLPQEDGEHYWMAFKFPVEDASGRRFVAGKSFDISDRKRAEEQIAALNRDLNLRVNELQTLLEVIPLGIGIALDPECRDIRINPAFSEWLNLPTEVNASTSQPNAEQLPYKVYRHGRELPPEEQPIQYAATHGVVVRNVDLDIVRNDGITLHLVGNASPLFDEQGNIRGCVGAFLDMSDVYEELRLRKQTEEALRISESLYRTLSEAVPAFIWSSDAEGRTEFVNSRWVEYTGMTLEELNSGGLEQVSHPDDFLQLMQQWHLAQQTGEIFEAEFRYRCKDGMYRWCISRAVPLKDAQDQVVKWIGSTTDIHERKQAEEALRQSEERLRVALKNSPISVFNQDRELRYTWKYNAAFEYEAEAVLGKRDADLLAADDAEVLAQIKRRVLETGVGAREEVKITMQGQDFYYDLTVEPLWGRDNEIIGVTCAAIDISDRKQVEMALQKSETLLNALLASTPIGLAFLDHDLRYIHANEALASINGLPLSETLGRTLEEVLPAWAPLLAPIFQQVMQTKQPLLNQELSGETNPPGLYRHSLVNYYPVCLPNGELLGVGVTSTDITKLKQAEEALRESEQRYRSLVMASSQIVWRANAQGQFVEVEGWEEFTGQPAEELLVEGSREAIHPDDLEWVRQAWWNAVTTKSIYEVEHRIRKYNGTYEYFSVRGVPVFDDEGEVRAWVGMSINIHARKQAEEALRLNRERLDLILEAAQLGLWYCDLPFNKLNWNDKCKEHFGLPPDADVTIDTFYQQIHPDDRERTRVAIERSLSQRTAYDIDYRTVAPDGQIRWIRAMGRGFYDPEGNPTRFDGITVDISDRKQAEEALRASESRFRVMADGAPVFIWMSGLDGHCTYFNQLWLDFVGQTLEEALAKGWPEGIHPDDKQCCLETYMTAFSAREKFQVEYRHCRKDGEYRWVFDVGVPLFNSDGSFAGYIGSGIDVTERRQAEQAQQYLAEASKVLSSSLDYQTTLGSIAHLTVPHLADWCTVHLIQNDGSVLPIVTAHVDPAKVMWAQKINEKYPFDPNEPRGVAQVLRTGQSELYPDIPDHLLVESARDAEHLEILREVGFKSVMIVPLWVRGKTLGAIAFISAESGRCYNQADLALAEELGRRAALAVENARLYRQAQQARQAAEQAANRTTRLQALTAAFSEALTPAEVALVVVNQGISALEAQAGFVVLLMDNDTTLGIVESVGLPPEVLELWQRFPVTADVPMAELVRTGEPIFLENAEMFVSQYPTLADISTILNNAYACIPLIVEGQTIGGMSFGFTDERAFSEDDRAFMLTLGQQCAQAIARARLYEAEQQARTQAESANRIKDEFLAVLSHELRSPLNPILGWVRLLRSRKFDEKATDRALETIERNAKLQTQLIEDLLDVSRILRGKMVLNVAPVNLATTIEAALETVRLSAQAKNIQIQTIFDSQVGQVLGDANRLQQVVWNLLSNAVKFTPSGGRVEVRLGSWKVRKLEGWKVGRLEDSQQLANLQPVTSYAQIQVSDTGKGIDPNFLPYVFDYFRQENSTTTRIFGGLGLGLAIVRHLVELHGGTVSADSPGLEQGATFTIRLPLMELATTPDEEDVLLSDSPSLQGISILVVDDENDTRELLVFTLEQYGAQVTAAASAKDALRALDELTPDILLSDIGMPETDGYMLIRQIRAMSRQEVRDIPAIALTAYAGETDRQQIFSAGFQQHVTKPVEPDVLASAIANLIRDSHN